MISVHAELEKRLCSLVGGQLSHAYILSGDAGVGKKTLAYKFAEAILCGGENAPCGKCRSCTVFEADSHPDFVKLFPEGKAREIGVGTIRKLKQDCMVKPLSGDCRAVVLHEADRMNTAAQNAFLKLLEEPPEGTVFILLTTTLTALLPTIRSRCVGVAVPPASTEDIEKALAPFAGASSVLSAAEAAAYGDGNIGKAKNALLADQNHPYRIVPELMEALAENRLFDMLSLRTRLSDKKLLAEVAQETEVYCLDILKYISGERGLHFSESSVSTAAGSLTRRKTLNIIEAARRMSVRAQSSGSDAKTLAAEFILWCREEINK